MIDLWTGIGLVVLVGLVIWWEVNHPGPTPPDCDSLTSNDERCQALRIRQERAAQRMKKMGIRSLLDGRAAWQRINPMHAPEPPSKVVQMKRRKS